MAHIPCCTGPECFAIEGIVILFFNPRGTLRRAVRREFEFDATSNRFLDRLRNDAMLRVVGELLPTSTLDLVDCLLHLNGDFIGVEQGERIRVTRSAPHRLNET